MTAIERHFRTMACDAGVWLRGPRASRVLESVADEVIASVQDAAAVLTRFDAESELSRLNADPRDAVPVSPLLAGFVAAARRAGAATDGLVDATLLDEIERAGYPVSRDGVAGRRLDAALAAAPPRTRAAASSDRRYAQVTVWDGVVYRPAGLRLDSGGLGKGLAADRAARLVPAGVTFAIAIGGDLAVGGPGPQPVAVTGVRTPETVHTLLVGAGGVATSGIHARSWDGGHHLLDPATGRPAWTGLVAATAIANSAVGAEVLAKAAVLAGPRDGRAFLRLRGGVLHHESGRVEIVPAAPRVTVPRFVAA